MINRYYKPADEVTRTEKGGAITTTNDHIRYKQEQQRLGKTVGHYDPNDRLIEMVKGNVCPFIRYVNLLVDSYGGFAYLSSLMPGKRRTFAWWFVQLMSDCYFCHPKQSYTKISDTKANRDAIAEILKYVVANIKHSYYDHDMSKNGEGKYYTKIVKPCEAIVIKHKTGFVPFDPNTSLTMFD